MNTQTEENYLKAIYKLSFQGTVVTTNAIAEKVNTAAASVTDMIKKLALKKLIMYRKYQGVSLSPKGEKVAIEIVRKHRLWEMFLVEKLKFKWDEVHEIAEELEHIKSHKLADHLDEFLGFPKTDPHGDPIPDPSGKIRNIKSKPLSEMKKRSKSTMTGVIDHSSHFLRFLDSIHLSLGDEIVVDEITGYDSSMRVRINKKSSSFLSQQVTKNILVTDSNDKN